MRQLLPHPIDDVDPLDLYVPDVRTAPADRPWVSANMIASADGAAQLDGRAGGLGGPGDRHVLRVVRSLGEVILVGAATVRAERYRVPRPALVPTAAGGRAEDGATRRRPRLVVVTASGDLDVELPLFADPQHPPLIATTEAAEPARRAELAEVAEVVVLGEGPAVDLGALLGHLHAAGVRTVASEGGPNLLAQLADADLLDELFLTIAPVLVGTDATRILTAAPSGDLPRSMVLHRVLEEDGFLFLTYRRSTG